MPTCDQIRLPAYRRHKPTGQAVVTLAGRDVYLGKYGTAASRKEYRRLTVEWLANDGAAPIGDTSDLTIAELLKRYRLFVERHYRPQPGRRSNERANVGYAMKPLREIYGHTLVKDFGPLALKALQQQFIKQGLSRGVVNARIDRVRRMFKWAVSEQLAGPSLAHALAAVPGLRRGHCEARETQPIAPVADAVVDATLPHLPAVVADMVRFQRLTGCRPAEVCIVRPCDVLASGDVWEYRPESHKTQYRGRDRVIFIGPKAQDVLRTYLLREKTAYCFSPADSERKRRALLHAKRKTPLAYGNRPGTNRRRKPKHRIGQCYGTDDYLRAIRRACERAFPPAKELTAAERKAWCKAHGWSPNQLRHAAATQIRRLFGIEAAQTVLGHAQLGVTQVYAERDLAKAAAVIREVG